MCSDMKDAVPRPHDWATHPGQKGRLMEGNLPCGPGEEVEGVHSISSFP